MNIGDIGWLWTPHRHKEDPMTSRRKLDETPNPTMAKRAMKIWQRILIRPGKTGINQTRLFLLFLKLKHLRNVLNSCSTLPPVSTPRLYLMHSLCLLACYFSSALFPFTHSLFSQGFVHFSQGSKPASGVHITACSCVSLLEQSMYSCSATPGPGPSATDFSSTLLPSSGGYCFCLDQRRDGVHLLSSLPHTVHRQ